MQKKIKPTHGHSHCIVCGNKNPASLGLSFEAGDNGSVLAHFRGNHLLQGYQGILHGGIVASLLDAAMTHCLFHHEVEAVTGDLQVRYLKQIPFNADLVVRAKLVSSFSPLYKMESDITVEKQLMARAKAKFMKPY